MDRLRIPGTLTIPVTDPETGKVLQVTMQLFLSADVESVAVDSAPLLASSSAGPDPQTFTLVFDKPVTWVGSDPAGLDIDIEGEHAIFDPPGGAYTLSYVSGKGTDTLTLTFDGEVTYDITPMLAYITAGAPAGNITSLAGTPLAAFGTVDMTNLVVDTTAPTIAQREIPTTGDTIALLFSEHSVTGGTVGNGGFTLAASGGAVTMTYVSNISNVMTYSLSRIVRPGETVTLSYAPGDIEDASGNPLAAITNAAVTNSSTAVKPTVSLARIVGSNTNTAQFQLTLSETCTGGTTGNGGFTFTASGGALTVTYAMTSLGVRYYNCSRSVAPWEAITFDYTPGNIVDGQGEAMDAISGGAVVNDTNYLIDFNTATPSPTQSGAIGFVASTAYADPPGYGFIDNTAPAADRGSAPGCTRTDFFRDLAYTVSGNLKTFQIKCPVGGTMKVRVYGYDQYQAWGATHVTSDGGVSALLTVSNSAPNSVVVTLTDHDNDGIVRFWIVPTNGTAAVCNGVDIVRGGGTLPTAMN